MITGLQNPQVDPDNSFQPSSSGGRICRSRGAVTALLPPALANPAVFFHQTAVADWPYNRDPVATMAQDEKQSARWKRDAIIAGTAGLVVAAAIGLVTAILGHFSDAEARRLVEATIPTSRLFCSTLMTVGATILALMLTMIGVGSSTDAQLSDTHYHRILKISFYDTLLFGLAAMTFIFHCVPVYESDSLPDWWYTSIYYTLLTMVSALGGGAVAITSLLYFAVKDMVQVIGLGASGHHLSESEQTDQEQSGR